MNGQRFAGKNVMVTGAGRGIGQEIAFRFAAEGADVMLLGRTAGPLEETAAEVAARGGRAWVHPADVTRSDQVRGAVEAAVARWGRLDVLINNAGVDDETPFLEILE